MTIDRRDPEIARARPRMSDVGRLAGVSAQSVSRFLTGNGYVSEDAASRIRSAIDTLGYRPNRIARSLHGAQTDVIGVLTAGDLNYGSAQTLTGMSAAAQAVDVSLITAHLEHANAVEPALVRSALERMLSMRVDGIVVSARVDGLEDILQEVVRDEVPVVTIAGRPRFRIDSIVADSYAAGALVMRHLIGLGHRRIVHLSGPADSDEAREREHAYRDALVAAELPAMPVLVGEDWTSAAGYEIGLSADLDALTAVFAGNDELALGFMAAARERGRSAPLDYSIAGVDDMPEARFFAPPLTTARLDFRSLGSTAFDMIRARVQGEPGRSGEMVEPVLVVRESTAPFQGPLPG